MYIPAYVAAAGLWVYGVRRKKRRLNEETIPLIAVVTALSFALMLIAVPIPGGTSVHASGIGLLAVLFGVWISFLSVSMVLLIQTLLFGIGGITSLPINALAMGFSGSAAAAFGYSLLRRHNDKLALFVAGWLSVVVPAVLVAMVLGVQPVLAHDPKGIPLFFPFGISVTLPAVTIPNAIMGVGEGILTVLVYSFFARFRNKTP